MQERRSALAVCMGLASQSCQIPAQLVVQALYVVGMCFANRVLLSSNDAGVRPVCICAVVDVLVCRQLWLQRFGCLPASIAQGKPHDLVTSPVYCPPQPDGLFFEPT